MTNQQAPEALFYADALDGCAEVDFDHIFVPAAAVIRRLHAENERLAALVEAQQPAAHVQNPGEIEHVVGDVSKNGPKSNMTRAQVDAIVYACRQAGDDSTYAVVNAALQAHQPAPSAAANLHPKTADLVQRFAAALADKLAAAEKKYGYSDGWASPDWMDECRLCLREHLFKGDPRDVAAYCAFLWHHGESTALPSEVVEDRVKEFEQLFPARKSSTPQADESPIPADYGGEPRTDCGLEGAYPKIVWIANTLYAMRHMHTLDSTWRGQLVTMAATANFVAKQIAAVKNMPQADSQPAPPTEYPALPEPSATGLGDEYEAYDRNGRAMGKAYETILYFKADQMRAYVDADRAARKQGGAA